MQNRVKPNEKIKLEIGTQCCNCGSIESLEYHHIIPLALGGNDIKTNMCCLCFTCHELLHNGQQNSNYRSRSELIKEGIAKSKKKQGRKLGTLDKMTNELKEDIELYLKDKNITQNDLMSKHNICRNTLKKYIKITEENKKVANGDWII